jgi:hypothetical protein
MVLRRYSKRRLPISDGIAGIRPALGAPSEPSAVSNRHDREASLPFDVQLPDAAVLGVGLVGVEDVVAHDLGAAVLG